MSDEQPIRAVRQLFDADLPNLGLRSRDLLTETKVAMNACAKRIGVPPLPNPFPHLLADNRTLVMVLLIGGKQTGERGLGFRQYLNQVAASPQTRIV